MNCGCGQYYPFQPSGCGISNQVPTGPYTCVNFPAAVKKNFSVPASGVDAVIEVTNTSHFYDGQGVQIGNGYYMITEIVDTTHITIQHTNILHPDIGTIIVAIHPEYGCYQYPVIPVGAVSLTTTPTVIGLAADRTAVVASAITDIGSRALTYSFLGPRLMSFNAYAYVTIANTPAYVAFELPFLIKNAVPYPAYSGALDEGSGPVASVATYGVATYLNYALVGKGGASTYTNGAGRIVSVSGLVEIAE
jgi:hypothetical protein